MATADLTKWCATGDPTCALIYSTASTFCPDIYLQSTPPADASDPNGAKAPGKPGEAEGFEDPKGGENWVPNPNGSGNGWEAANGHVWVPTGWAGAPGTGTSGPAHGGPHWDVQDPKTGDSVNVYPGGTVR